MAQTYDTFWQSRFARAIEAKMQHLAESICTGQLAQDEYKLAAGQLRGLQTAIETITEVNDEIRKAEQGSK